MTTENNWWDYQQKIADTAGMPLNVSEWTKDIRVAWGEHQLKKWFDLEMKHNTGWLTLKRLKDRAKADMNLDIDLAINLAVDALGEQKCLELLEKWWGNKNV